LHHPEAADGRAKIVQTGVLFLILAMLLTPAVDGVAKTLSVEHTAMEVAFLRYFTAGLIAVGVARATGRRIVVERDDRLGMVFRTVLIMGAMTRSSRRSRSCRWPRRSAAS
jgi:drug/metabolite transporter (DMT)-like permease